MKKLLFALLCFFILAFVSSTSAIVIVRTAPPAAGGCDDCSGDLKFSWHFENTDITSGTPCGCVDASGDTVAAVSAGSPAISGTQSSDGSNSGSIPAATTSWEFDVTSADIADKDEGKIVFDAYITTFVTNTMFLRVSYDTGNDYLQIVMRGGANDVEVRGFYFNGTGQTTTTTGIGNHTANEWLRITYQWKVANSASDHRIEICDLTPPDTTSNCDSTTAEDDLTVFAAEPEKLYVGNLSGNAAAFYIDNLQIYATSGL